jgi:hypothetical protein
MITLRAAAQLLPFCLIVSCGLHMDYEAQYSTFVKQRDASYFIVNDAKVNSLLEAQNQCASICLEEGGTWTGTWSDQNPFAHPGGVCECTQASAQAAAAEVQVYPQPMSVDEMSEAFEVSSTQAGEKAVEEPRAAAQESQVSTAATKQSRSSSGAQKSTGAGSATSQASAGGDVSATVHRDPKTGTVTATAQAGRAKAVARTPPSGEATATIHRDPKTGTVTATASAGGATATATSRKDPFNN